MKLQRNTLKMMGMIIIIAMYVAFMILLPSVFAQGENSSTPTPDRTPLPFPETTPEPFLMPAQPLNQAQSILPLGGDWAAQVNISDTTEETLNPEIATGADGILHFVWSELIGGKHEIYYTQIDGLTQLMPVNVSNSASLDSSLLPKIVADGSGTAHIIWQEEDDDHADDWEILYSQCGKTGCTIPIMLSDGLPCSPVCLRLERRYAVNRN